MCVRERECVRACVLEVTGKTSNEVPHSTFVCIISRVLLFYCLCTSVDPVLFCIMRFGHTLCVGAFVFIREIILHLHLITLPLSVLLSVLCMCSRQCSSRLLGFFEAEDVQTRTVKADTLRVSAALATGLCHRAPVPRPSLGHHLPPPSPTLPLLAASVVRFPSGLSPASPSPPSPSSPPPELTRGCLALAVDQ